MSLTKSQIANWETLILDSGRTKGDLSRAVGKDRSYLPKVLTPNGPEPSVLTAIKVANEIGVSLERLMCLGGAMTIDPDPSYQRALHEQASHVLSDVMRVAHRRLNAQFESDRSLQGRDFLSVLLRWWNEQGGKLLEHEAIQEKFDLIAVPSPTDETVTPVRVGAESIAASALGTNEVDALRQLVLTFTQEDQRELARGYLEASKTMQPRLSAPIKATLPSKVGDEPRVVEYFRLQLPVTSSDNSMFILSYCFPV